ncbi:PAS domain S-box protein [Stigmatella sp. ncwal1]|uniref:histidine kinase n=1 Tax=Stigmatella ashevillensis TaxID=2995309 RepID=A0ABT5D2S4_9BACT|nr:PAS domain S-box protein [Stigmatella ashevillena]MDC0707969.1 PAS domain S-box protein [Stigmatella ashevillena]
MSKKKQPHRKTSPARKKGASSRRAAPRKAPPRLSDRLAATQRMLQALTQAHAEFIVWGEHRALLQRLLALALELTQSDLGFIGEMVSLSEGEPFLRPHAIFPLDWTEALRGYTVSTRPASGGQRSATTLFDAVLGADEPLWLKTPTRILVEGSPAASLPDLSHFLVLPFAVADKPVGRVVLTNRPGGYDSDLIEFLQPLLTTCGTLLHAWRNDEHHRRAEQTLQAQQQQMKKLALVAARTHNAVIITDAAGVIEWVNEGFTRITGYTAEESLHRRPGELLYGPNTDPAVTSAIHQAILSGEGSTAEMINYRKNGEPYWNHADIQPVRDEHGRLVQFVSIENDVTARRSLEQQVAQSAERLQLALESTEDGLWDLDLLTGKLTVSPRWLGLLGYEEGVGETNYRHWREKICHPDDLPEAERRMNQHLLGHSPMYEFEHRLQHRAGAGMWVLSRGKVVSRSEEGRPLRVVGTNSNITSRKQAQERIQAFIRAIPDAIYRMKTDGTFVDYKPSVNTKDLSVLPPAEFLGRKIYDLPELEILFQPTRNAIQQLLQGSPLEIYEYAVETPNGVVHYESRLVYSGGDEVMSIVRNITERKLAEEHQRRQAERLAEQVSHVTRELEARQAQLIQSEKLASLGQMAASIAHELNNPVGYVSSNVSTLATYASLSRRLLEISLQVEKALGAQPPAPVAALLEEAITLREQEHLDEHLADLDEVLADTREGLARIREFVLNLKTFVREESDVPQLADVNKGLRMTLRMLRHEFRERCEVICDFAPLPLLRCFPTQLNQVFMNLLLNAAQAIEQRGQIYVTAQQEETDVVVRIRDTGRGMDARTRARIFTPFFTTKPAGQGTGLGLTICDTIIRRHQGRIEVQSEPGQGTTFTVRLPLFDDEDEDEGPLH